MTRMRHAPPIIVTVLLLIAAAILADDPLVKAFFLLLLIAACGIASRRLLARWLRRFALRRGGGLALWGVGGVAALAGFCAMLATQPALEATYLPGQPANGIVERRGFYGTETDAAANRYAWTEERATLVFDFLVHKPITLTVAMRSAAIAGGRDAPVVVEVNGKEVGSLQPDPKNLSFQPLSLRFVPFDWGGERTEIRLRTETFVPGKSDTRALGTMVQRVTIDKREAWAGVARHRWIVWALPVCALAVVGLTIVSRRYRLRYAGHAVIALCLAGALCAALLAVIVGRIGVIQRATYYTWLPISSSFALAFAVGAITLPFGATAPRSLWRRAHGRFVVPHYVRAPIERAGMRLRRLRQPMGEGPSPSRRDLVRDLALVFAVAFGVRLLWVVVVPPWQAPDEPDHFGYVTQLVEQHRIPHAPFPDYPPYSTEETTSWNLSLFTKISSLGNAAPPPLAHLPVGYDYGAARQYTAPYDERRSASAGRASPHPPLYYAVVAIPYTLVRDAPILTRLYATRSGSAVLGSLSCVFAYLIAYELRRTRRWGWTLGLSMALMPMYAFVTASINSDVGMDFAATVVLWLVARAWRREPLSPRLALAIGAASGGALLTKATVAPVVAFAGLAVVAKVVWAYRSSWHRHAAVLGAFAVAVLALYGPWLLLRYHFTKQLSLFAVSFMPFVRFLTGTEAVAAAPPGVPAVLSTAHLSLWQYIELQKGHGWGYFRMLFIENFWGVFGWLDIPLAACVYAALTAIVLIGVIGFILHVTFQGWRRRTAMLPVGALFCQAFFLFIVIDWYTGYVRTGQEFGLQGRYFFPILALVLYLLISGWEYLCGDNGLALRLAPIGMMILQVVALATVCSRYYGLVIG